MKSSTKKILIILGILLLLTSYFLFKKILGQTLILYPGQDYFSIKSWQHVPPATQWIVGILGAFSLLIGIIKK